MIYPSHSFQSLILVLVFFSILFLWSSSSRSVESYVPYARKSWQFNPDQHANTHTLSNEQCDVAFPRLYESLENSIRKRNGRKVQHDEISIKDGRCMLRLMIYDGELFVISDGAPDQCYVKNGNERERILGTLAQIDRALTTSASSDPAIPNVEFSISLDDLPRRSKASGVFWGYTRQDHPDYDDIWLMPNYAFWSWNYTHAPSWNAIRKEIQAAEDTVRWEKKDPRAVWRGKIKMAQLRQELIRVSGDQSWADIKPVVINNASDSHSADVMELNQFCQYKYTVQTEGTSYSGRLKYLQLCRSALITHPLQWQEIHTHLLQLTGPDANYIETSENFANLPAAMDYYRQHDSKAKEIATNSYNTFARRYLTPAAITCYWRKMFWNWALVQGYKVELYTKDNTGKMIPKGTPWTAFAANWPLHPELIP